MKRIGGFLLLSTQLTVGTAYAVSYVGSTSSGDITFPAHWNGGAAPGASDTGAFAYGTAQMPSAGLSLGDDFALGSMTWLGFPKGNPVALDLSSHTLSVAGKISIGDATGKDYTGLKLKDGLVTNVAELTVGNGGSLELENARLCFGPATLTFDRNARLRIDRNSEFHLQRGNGDRVCNFSGSYSRFTVDGGKIVSEGAGENGNWYRSKFGDSGTRFEVVNGGVYDNRSANAAFEMTGTGSQLAVTNGASFLLTNASNRVRGFMMQDSRKGVVSLTNGTFRAFTWHVGNPDATSICDACSEARILVHDSVVSLHYPQAGNGNEIHAGMVFGSKAVSNRVEVSGGASQFSASVLTLGGYRNAFGFADGTLG